MMLKFYFPISTNFSRWDINQNDATKWHDLYALPFQDRKSNNFMEIKRLSDPTPTPSLCSPGLKIKSTHSSIKPTMIDWLIWISHFSHFLSQYVPIVWISCNHTYTFYPGVHVCSGTRLNCQGECQSGRKKAMEKKVNHFFPANSPPFFDTDFPFTLKAHHIHRTGQEHSIIAHIILICPLVSGFGAGEKKKDRIH